MTRPARRASTPPNPEALQRMRTRTGLEKAPRVDPVLAASAAQAASAPEKMPPSEATPPMPPIEAAAPEPETPAPAQPSRPPKHKVALYMHEEDAARARAAFTWTRAHEGVLSWSDFINDAVMRRVAELEEQYNNGEQWTPVPTGTLPRGRPPAL